MTKLIIKKKGLFISIPGITEFRTPAEIDITNINLGLVIAALSKTGVITYQIQTKDTDSLKDKLSLLFKKKENISIITEKDNITIDTRSDEILNLVKNQAETIKNIEGLLSNFLSSDYKDKGSSEESKKIKKIEEVEEFIPTINISKTKIKGSSTSSIKTKSNFSKAAENLSTIIDKK